MESPDFLADWLYRRTQHSGDETSLAIEQDDGLEAIFVMMSVEQAQLLSTTDSIEGVIGDRRPKGTPSF